MSYLTADLGLTSAKDPCGPECPAQPHMMFRPGEELIKLSNSDLLRFIDQYLAKPKHLDDVPVRHTTGTARPSDDQRRAQDATTDLMNILRTSDVGVGTLSDEGEEHLPSDVALEASLMVELHTLLSSEPFSEWQSCNGEMQPRLPGELYDPAGPYFNWLSNFAQEAISRCTVSVMDEGDENKQWLTKAIAILQMLEEAGITGLFAAGIVKQVKNEETGKLEWAWAKRDICGPTGPGAACRYGHDCFRKNPEHLHRYKHPTTREKDLLYALVAAKNRYKSAFHTQEIPPSLIQAAPPPSGFVSSTRKRGLPSQGGLPSWSQPSPKHRRRGGGRSKKRKRRPQKHRRTSKTRKRRRRSPYLTRRRV